MVERSSEPMPPSQSVSAAKNSVPASSARNPVTIESSAARSCERVMPEKKTPAAVEHAASSSAPP
jgi:hypothetical protein